MAFTVATRDPDGPLTVALVVGGAGVAIGALAVLAFVSVATRGAKRGPARAAAIARAIRRGTMVGCTAALLIVLRAVDGLTPVTAVFVVAPFVVAEAVLSTRRA